MTDFAPLTLETPAEHPFAPFVRILGKGKRGEFGGSAVEQFVEVQAVALFRAEFQRGVLDQRAGGRGQLEFGFVQLSLDYDKVNSWL